METKNCNKLNNLLIYTFKYKNKKKTHLKIQKWQFITTLSDLCAMWRTIHSESQHTANKCPRKYLVAKNKIKYLDYLKAYQTKTTFIFRLQTVICVTVVRLYKRRVKGERYANAKNLFAFMQMVPQGKHAKQARIDANLAILYVFVYNFFFWK